MAAAAALGAGLGEVLHAHGRAALRRRGMLPLLGEVTLSIVWAVGFVACLALVVGSWLLPSRDPLPLIAWWGLVISLLALAQANLAVLLAHRYQRRLWRLLPSAILHVLAVWMVGSFTGTLYAVPAIVRGPRRDGSVRWATLHRAQRTPA